MSKERLSELDLANLGFAAESIKEGSGRPLDVRVSPFALRAMVEEIQDYRRAASELQGERLGYRAASEAFERSFLRDMDEITDTLQWPETTESDRDTLSAIHDRLHGFQQCAVFMQSRTLEDDFDRYLQQSRETGVSVDPLFAASPALLEAAVAALMFVADDFNVPLMHSQGARSAVIDQLRAAIAQAQGEEGDREG